MGFKNLLKERQLEIDKIIKFYLPHKATYQKIILESMNYSITVGGKRLRPLLMMETYKLFGGNSNVIKPFIAAIEMIHTYSLVHDDLPAMDNDDYRRGQFTTHKKFGEAIGILTGDALLNYAYEIMSKACIDNKNDIEVSVRAMSHLSKNAGIYGMIGGQVVDVISENQSISLNQLDYIHLNKTAALIGASMTVGAILANAKEKEIDTISNIGKNIGLAFQIQDDILDITSTMDQLGKPIKSDEKNNKSTYVSILGFEQSKEKVNNLSQTAVQQLKKLKGDTIFLNNLIDYLITRLY